MLPHLYPRTLKSHTQECKEAREELVVLKMCWKEKLNTPSLQFFFKENKNAFVLPTVVVYNCKSFIFAATAPSTEFFSGFSAPPG
jgi:hypothetical protein